MKDHCEIEKPWIETFQEHFLVRHLPFVQVQTLTDLVRDLIKNAVHKAVSEGLNRQLEVCQNHIQEAETRGKVAVIDAIVENKGEVFRWIKNSRVMLVEADDLNNLLNSCFK